jgi:glycosyltransferase involved in cell wall biosynthesis
VTLLEGPVAPRHQATTEHAGPTSEPLPRSSPSPISAPVASVVIPAYRAADTIVACLRGLHAQDLAEPFEVIVVASGGDATRDIVRRAFPGVVLIDARGRLSPGAGRNLGVAAARAQVIAFLPADCVPEVDWLRRRLRAHRRGHQLVGGFVDVAIPSTLAGWAQYFAKFWGMLRLERARGLGRGPIFHLSYTRSLLDAFGPFPQDCVAGEDTAFNHLLVAAGHRVWFDSRIRIRHLNSRRWADVLTGQREQGAATGALCRDGAVARYYAPSAQGGPLTPLVLLGRALATVGRHRRDLLMPFLVCAPLVLTAIAVRRRSFRRAMRGHAFPPSVDAPVAVRRVPPATSRLPAVSVVVAAYNEAEVLAECLDSLLAQTMDAMEVLVVDDGSTDRTVEVATSRGVPVKSLEHRGAARARNIGASMARGRVIVFVDADLRLAPDCIERLAAPILSGDELATYTRDIGVANADDLWGACWSLNRGLAPGTYMPPGLPDRWANARAVDRIAFLRVGGYDDVGYGEDMTLAPKLGVLALAVPGALMWHHNPDSLREVWQNARWVGRGVRIRERGRVWRDRAPWRSLRRGLAVARHTHLPRYVFFRLTYDVGILVGHAQSRLAPGRHWK